MRRPVARLAKALGTTIADLLSERRLISGLLVGVAVLSMSVDALSRNLRRWLRVEALPVRLSADHGANSARSAGAYPGGAHAQQPVV